MRGFIIQRWKTALTAHFLSPKFPGFDFYKRTQNLKENGPQWVWLYLSILFSHPCSLSLARDITEKSAAVIGAFDSGRTFLHFFQISGSFPSISFLQFASSLTLAQTPPSHRALLQSIVPRGRFDATIFNTRSRPYHASIRPSAAQSSSQIGKLTSWFWLPWFHSNKEKSEVTNSCFENEQNLFCWNNFILSSMEICFKNIEKSFKFWCD